MIGPAGYVLLASLAANAALGWLWLSERDARVLADERVQAQASAAQACSAGVEKLASAADAVRAAGVAAAAAARAAQSAANRRADAILAAPPAVPGDDCASARVRADAWLAGRAAP